LNGHFPFNVTLKSETVKENGLKSDKLAVREQKNLILPKTEPQPAEIKY
jgi:hypothetical protein